MNKHLNTDFVCIIELLEYLHKLLVSGKKINNIFKKFLHKEQSQEKSKLQKDYEKILENNDVEKYTINTQLDNNKDNKKKVVVQFVNLFLYIYILVVNKYL